jgi:N-succinyldiaminopimelate aminotransferase
LLYVCSPANPTGNVLSLEQWRHLFDLSDRYGFVIASDECYCEIYMDEAHPPLSALQAAQRLGRDGFPRLVSFGSLSKRSNVPGMRSDTWPATPRSSRSFCCIAPTTAAQ